MSAARTLRIGTRGSELAMWQARQVRTLLAAQPGAPPLEIIQIKTEGDQRTDIPLWQAGGRAFFTREIDQALVSSRVDVAVHSLKDLSTALEPGLTLGAVLEREDPRDALVSRAGSHIAALSEGARVGTSSLRRRAFLARLRNDLNILELRGNVPTRVERLFEGRYDAIILAVAGLKRLGLEDRITHCIPAEEFLPAVSQGAIGVLARDGDAETLRWLSALDHAATRQATIAERALLRKVEGGCQIPLGALARLESGQLTLHATVASLDGSTSISAMGRIAIPAAPDAAEHAARELGNRVGAELLAKGATRIIEMQRRPQPVDAP